MPILYYDQGGVLINVSWYIMMKNRQIVFIFNHLPQRDLETGIQQYIPLNFSWV